MQLNISQSPNKGLAPFLVNAVGKKHSTPGDYYGTFIVNLDAFSPKTKRERGEIIHEPHNFLGSNGKEGGPGYVDICINPYPEHLKEPYGKKMEYKQFGAILNGPMYNAVCPQEYFDKQPFIETPLPNKGIYLKKVYKEWPALDGPMVPTGPGKWQGGSHDGCFNKFPEFMPCKYFSVYDATKKTRDQKIETPYVPPSACNKTFYTFSIVNHDTDIRVNYNNCKTYVPQYVKHLLCENGAN